MKAVMQTLLLFMLASLGLTGCGQKGDLFLPITKPPVSTPADPAVVPASTQQQPTAVEKQQPATAKPASPDPIQHSPSNTKR